MNTQTSAIRGIFAGLLLAALLLAAPGAVSQASARPFQAAGDGAVLSEKSSNPVVGSAQSFNIFFTFINSGTTTWQPGTYWLQNISNPYGATLVQPLSGPVVPGGLSTWTIRIKAPVPFGVYSTTWQVYHSGIGFGPLVTVDFKVAPGWVGGVTISSDFPLVGVGRPQIDTQVMAYAGVPSGSTTVFVPMLFRNAWSIYNAALYIQNVDAGSAADITVHYYDADGNLTCTRNDNIPALASHGYWLPKECVPNDWVGGAVITSDRDIIALGRPHIGAEITTYNGFSSGSSSMYVPMLFSRAWNSYNAALYIQNTDAFSSTDISIQYRDLNGNLTCTHNDTLAPRAARGYWIPLECVPTGWVGGAVITSSATDIVAIGRPHIGTRITAYNGFASGSQDVTVPMLYKSTSDGNESALYIQNLDNTFSGNIEMYFYDMTGDQTCFKTDTIPPFASHGYWLAAEDCLPEDWRGSVEIRSDTSVVAMGRPHYGTEIFAYDGFVSNSTNAFLPMLFRVAFDGTYNAAFYLHNVDVGQTANVTMDYYDSSGLLVCSVSDTIGPLAALEVQVANIDLPCP